MKTKEALKIIDERWVKKRKGFRVHFQKMVNAELKTDYIPPEEAGGGVGGAVLMVVIGLIKNAMAKS